MRRVGNVSKQSECKFVFTNNGELCRLLPTLALCFSAPSLELQLTLHLSKFDVMHFETAKTKLLRKNLKNRYI